MKIFLYLLLIILMQLQLTSSNHCDRTPDGMLRGKNTDDVYKYVIEISGDPTTYIPGKTYTVTIRHNANSGGIHMFRDFMLSVEKEDINSQTDSDQIQKVGFLKLSDDMLSMFSRKCENTIQQTSSIPKSSIQVDWIAPPTNAGCLAFRATVAESKENWYGEEGSLTKVLCESASENEDEQPAILERCCACQEAKYELVFEGLWTRNTHPKDYPSNIWYTKFGEIVGASHSNDESFWKYEDYASENLKALAERGDTNGVEMELKEQMGKTVRTIIKANSLRYPNITGKTFAFFRVDRANHLVSIVSKITPSPDWIVGVSSFELCQDNCSWVEQRVLNLYPWDIGSDDGPSYNSINLPASSPSTIQRIKSDDPSSPFYDEKGNDIKPFAKLYFTRLKTYQMECNNEELNNEGNSEVTTEEEVQSEECRTKPWSSWSACSKTCGEGLTFRKRELRKPENEDICNVKLVDHKICTGKKCKHGTKPDQLQSDDPRCELTEWSAWSGCTTECGNGTMTRDKKFKHSQYAAQCANNDPAITQQNEVCQENGSFCPEGGKEETDCSKTNWGPWTPCSVTCGNGNKTRLRMPDEGEQQEGPTESECKNMETVTCYEPLCESEGTTITDFGGITSLGQVSTERIYSEPYGPVINCVVSDWSIWGPCELVEGNCGKGYVTQHRQIQQHAMNGGKPCPIRLMRKRRCHVKCHKEEEDISTTQQIETTEADTGDSVDCVMSHWSQWSPCSLSCGSTAVQQRTRNIKIPPGKNGKPCGNRLEQKACPLPLACTDKGLPIM